MDHQMRAGTEDGVVGEEDLYEGFDQDLRYSDAA